MTEMLAGPLLAELVALADRAAAEAGVPSSGLRPDPVLVLCLVGIALTLWLRRPSG